MDALSRLFHLAQGRIDEALATKAGVDAHDQNQINVVDQPIEHVQGLGGVEHQTHLTTRALDGLHTAVHMGAGVGVKTDQIGTGFGKGLGQGVHRRDHQMHVDRHRHAGRGFGMRLEGLANHGAEGEVGHIMVVHHIEMNPVCAGINDLAHLLTEAGKVSRQNGWGDAIGGRVHGAIISPPDTPDWP